MELKTDMVHHLSGQSKGRDGELGHEYAKAGSHTH